MNVSKYTLERENGLRTQNNTVYVDENGERVIMTGKEGTEHERNKRTQ